MAHKSSLAATPCMRYIPCCSRCDTDRMQRDAQRLGVGQMHESLGMAVHAHWTDVMFRTLKLQK
jgi:hypothetical protein